MKQSSSVRNSGMRRKQNLLFAFSLPLFFSLFLPHFFSLAGHLVAFIVVGKVFRNAIRMLGLDQVSGTRVFFAFFSGVLD